MADIKRWGDRLSLLLGFETTEIIEYLYGLDQRSECQDYLEQLLGTEPDHQAFIRDFVHARFPEIAAPKPVTVVTAGGVWGGSGGDKVKKDIAASRDARNISQAAPQPSTRGGSLKQTATTTNVMMGPVTTPAAEPKPKLPKKMVYKAVKPDELRTRVEEGRRLCTCMALKHKLLGNCIACGRVMCAQEGYGECLFCGQYTLHGPGGGVGDAAPVAMTKTALEKEKKMKRANEDAEARMLSVLGRDSPYAPDKMREGLERALVIRDKLLQYDRQAAQRTKVIDDEMDYFQINNKWLDSDERAKRQEALEELEKAKKDAGRRMVFTLDIVSRKLVPDSEAMKIDEQAFAEQHLGKDSKEKKLPDINDVLDLSILLHHPGVKQAPVFIPPVDATNSEMPKIAKAPVIRRSQKVQDAGVTQMTDHGMCLSMHQPWASLLVAGIKTIEGRSWYTAHRGRLWIAATVRAPVPSEVDAVEAQYRTIYQGENFDFPEYPISCLLGCVDLVDCLTQDEYKEKYGQSATHESQSAYLFVCENARELPVKLKMTGDHKIYKLDASLHKTAKQALAVALH